MVYGTVGGVISGSVSNTYNFGEQQYDVRGLLNPYLGLGSFTYDYRARYAGRDRDIAAAVQLLTNPGAQRTLLCITGASGSGKSSFAQAGLLPALEMLYQPFPLRWAVFRPSTYPLAGLLDALERLGIALDGLTAAEVIAQPELVAARLRAAAAQRPVAVVIVDQLEELFTQSEAAQRDALFAILETLPPFVDLRAHFITTLRSDYLPELFERPRLYELAKQGLDLRAMRVAELKAAIRQPLHALLSDLRRPPDALRFEPALLERLARDAAEDAAYLPLLQVTLEDIWARGTLKLAAYTTLTDAITLRAEEVYHYADLDGQREPRPASDQSAIMAIFLDLVNVSLDDDPRRDVRQRRPFADLTHDSSDRARLVEDLSRARLLSRTVEPRGEARAEVDVVDIVHESLLRNWTRLAVAIAAERTSLQQRARFEHSLRDWLAHDRADAYLLDGVRLAEAEVLAQRQDVALRDAQAQALLTRSIAQREAERQRELAEARWNARRLWALVAMLMVALVIAIGAAWYAQDQSRRAQQQARIARAGQLGAQSQAVLESLPQRSLLLAVEAISATREAGEAVVPAAENASARC